MLRPGAEALPKKSGAKRNSPRLPTSFSRVRKVPLVARSPKVEHGAGVWSGGGEDTTTTHAPSCGPPTAAGRQSTAVGERCWWRVTKRPSTETCSKPLEAGPPTRLRVGVHGAGAQVQHFDPPQRAPKGLKDCRTPQRQPGAVFKGRAEVPCRCIRPIPGPLQGPPGLLLSKGGEGGRGFWTQNLVYQKWPDQIFPIVNFVFSHYGHFGLGRGEGGFGGGVPPPLGF